MQKGQTQAVGYAVRSRSWCKEVNSHSGLRKYGWWGPLPLVQKGQTHSGVHRRYAVRSRYAVCSRCWCKKVNSHSGLSKYGWWGPLPLVQKGQTHSGVHRRYAVRSRYAVHSRSWCKKVNSDSGLSKYGWWGLLLSQGLLGLCHSIETRDCIERITLTAVLFD